MLPGPGTVDVPVPSCATATLLASLLRLHWRGSLATVVRIDVALILFAARRSYFGRGRKELLCAVKTLLRFSDFVHRLVASSSRPSGAVRMDHISSSFAYCMGPCLAHCHDRNGGLWRLESGHWPRCSPTLSDDASFSAVVFFLPASPGSPGGGGRFKGSSAPGARRPRATAAPGTQAVRRSG